MRQCGQHESVKPSRSSRLAPQQLGGHDKFGKIYFVFRTRHDVSSWNEDEIGFASLIGIVPIIRSNKHPRDHQVWMDMPTLIYITINQ